MVGIDVLIEGNIPWASGLSSSSALCTCTALGVIKAHGEKIKDKGTFIDRVVEN